jgi:DeoR/GlpR family transcriptional regulator of sugar metabolism
MEALAVERPHTPSIKPHGEKAHESGFFSVGDLADVDILITTAPIPEFTKVLKDKPGQIKIKKD